MVRTDCHTAHGYRWPGSRYLGTVAESRAPIPGFRRLDIATCDSCPTDRPHGGNALQSLKLNDQADRVGCQTCQIPEFAKGAAERRMIRPSCCWHSNPKIRNERKDGNTITYAIINFLFVILRPLPHDPKSAIQETCTWHHAFELVCSHPRPTR